MYGEDFSESDPASRTQLAFVFSAASLPPSPIPKHAHKPHSKKNQEASKMKVADADSKLVVEVQHHALMKVKDQLLQVINLRNVRGVSQFLGLGEEKPFNVPGREALAPRARKNVMFFSTNYAISAALVGVVTILLNPMFLFVLICLAGFWLYASSVAANETAENPMLVFGKPVSPEQRKLGLTGISLGVIVIFGGSILFTICTASSALAISHAILRDCPTVREEDELGFLSSDDADKIADTV